MTSYPPPPALEPKRSPLVWILAGCGCIAVAGIIIMGLLVAIGYPMLKRKVTTFIEERERHAKQQGPASNGDAERAGRSATSTAVDDDDPDGGGAVAGAATSPSVGSATSGQRPPLGAYGCRTYGNPSNPIYIMQITLADGPYETDRGAGGTWSYDQTTAAIEFDGGMLADSKFVGLYVPIGGEVQYITGSRSKARSHSVYLQTRDRWDAHPGVTDAKAIYCSLE